MKRQILICILLVQLLDFLKGQVPESDSLALVALYNSTNGAGWTDNTNWLQPGQPVSTWYGITLYNDTVEQIRLINNNLTGTLPDAIGDFSDLKYLYLGRNQISGTIPATIGNLAGLHILSLGRNQLIGAIPVEIGNLVHLNRLYLDLNQLTDSIPGSIENLTELITLELENNNLTGSIPRKIGNLTHLQYLFLDVNLLSDSIPVEIGNLSDLYCISLANNQLEGNIPAEIGNLDSLKWLSLENNELTGSIPEEICNLNKLEEIYLNDNNLGGGVPEGIKNLPNLTTLKIQNNYFNFCDLESLTGIVIATFEYYPQGTIALTTSQINSTIGNNLEFDITDLTLSECSAANNQYQWWKDDAIVAPYSDSPVLSLVDLNNDDEGEYYCTMTNSDFPDLTLTTDTFSLVLGGPTAIKLQNKKQNTVSVFPNPISEYAILEYSSDKIETLSVDLFNLQGYLVHSFISNIQLQPGTHQIQLIFNDNFPAGIYMLVITDNSGRQCFPITKY